MQALILVFSINMIGLVVLHLTGAPPIARYLVSDLGITLTTLMAAIIGLEKARVFGFRSVFGKSLLLVSVGLIVWALGEFTWMIYNTAVEIEMPYPSLADVGFVGLIPFAALGLFFLLRNLKLEFDLPTVLKILVIPSAVFVFSYVVFIQSRIMEDTPPLQKLLNVIYPVGDAIFLSFGFLILSLVWRGRLLKPFGILCVGFIVEAIADASFSWTSTDGTYYVGNWVDALFSLAFFLIGIGLYYMKVVRVNDSAP